MKKVNASPPQFKGMTAVEIAQEIAGNLDGEITIDVSGASEAERAPIREAAQIDVEAGGDSKRPVIHFIGDNSDSAPDEKGFSEEDQILRVINYDILRNNDGVNIGRIAFRRFIKALLEEPENYPLVRDEWNKFIVGHDHTGKVDSPYESHHLPNVGLKPRSEGKDVLREHVTGFIMGIMEEVRDRVAALFEQTDEFLPHANAGMNTPDARLLAIGEAEWSNLVRGAAYYRHRQGESSLDQYPPRRLAANIVDGVIAENSR